jgi:cellulose biosynthesis protein BcsQ
LTKLEKSENPIAIAVSNRKGGVGKTTISSILTQIALSKTDKKVCAIDLDPQKNFTDSMSLFVKNNPTLLNNLVIKDAITQEGDFIIVDCPPALENQTKMAIEFADIIIVPIMADFFSLLNLEVVFEIGNKLGKIREQMPIVTIGFNNAGVVLSTSIRQQFSERGYFIAGDLPVHKLIPFNMAVGNQWDKGMGMEFRKQFWKLYNDIEINYKKMLNNDIKNLWNGS